MSEHPWFPDRKIVTSLCAAVVMAVVALLLDWKIEPAEFIAYLGIVVGAGYAMPERAAPISGVTGYPPTTMDEGEWPPPLEVPES